MGLHLYCSDEFCLHKTNVYIAVDIAADLILKKGKRIHKILNKNVKCPKVTPELNIVTYFGKKFKIRIWTRLCQ